METKSSSDVITLTRAAEQYSMDALESALLDVDDVMSRAAVPYLVLGDVAQQMRNNEQLHSTGLDIGIRRNQLTPEVQRTIKQFQAEAEFDGDGFTYYWQGTPIRIYFLDPEEEAYKRPDTIWHNAWEYHVPNGGSL